MWKKCSKIPAGRRHETRAAIVTAFGVLTVLSACTRPLPYEPGPERFVVEAVSLDHEIRFASNQSDGLGEDERGRLQRFLDETDRDRAGAIVVSSSGADIAEDRRLTVEKLIQSSGRRLAGRDMVALPPDLVTVRISRNLILPASCLRGDGWPSADDLPMGCTNDLNLLESVENQRDLLQGRALGLAPAAPAGDLVRGYLERFKIPIEAPADTAPAPPQGAAY